MGLGLFWKRKGFEGARSSEDIRRGAKLSKRVDEVKIYSQNSLQFPSSSVPKPQKTRFPKPICSKLANMRWLSENRQYGGLLCGKKSS
jgi:hypothetical protein